MSSPILRMAMRLLLPLMLIFAAYMTLKGHNAPGGGFIGGLTAAIALALHRMAYGTGSLERLMPFHPRVLIFLGLLMAATTCAVPLFFGAGVLTSLVTDLHLPVIDQSVHFASAMFFDLGVLLTVVGVSLGMIERLTVELERR